MFTEQPFSSDDEQQQLITKRKQTKKEGDVSATGSSSNTMNTSTSRKRRTRSPDLVCGDRRPRCLHRPGDAGFQSFAGAVIAPAASASTAHHRTARAAMTVGKLDRIAVGDLWTSNVCHCLQCEVIRLKGKMDGLLQSPPCLSQIAEDVCRDNVGVESLHPSTANTNRRKLPILLMDLDNFGFHQLQRPEPAAPKGALPLSQTSFLWAFYGACFARHHSCGPEDVELTTQDCTLQRFKDHKCCCFTPCGGHKEAVDEVITAAAHMLGATIGEQVLPIVITGDRHLATFVAVQCKNVGVKVIDVNNCDRKIGNVWKAVRELCLVEEVRT
jgi:hypothetical protein